MTDRSINSDMMKMGELERVQHFHIFLVNNLYASIVSACMIVELRPLSSTEMQTVVRIR